MAGDGLRPGEVQAVTFGDSAIQPLGGAFPHLTRVIHCAPAAETSGRAVR